MTNVTSESDLAVTHFDVGDTLGELARWGCGHTQGGRQASVTNSLCMFLCYEGSRWAQSSQTEFYDDPTGFEFDADMRLSRERPGDEVPGRQFESLDIVLWR